MVAICTRLEKRGLIERRRLPEDRRYQVLNLTPEGRKVALLVRKRLTTHNQKMLQRMNRTQRKQLMLLMKLLIDD
jgi:DNA-binding MarR family transcriptional regulator